METTQSKFEKFKKIWDELISEIRNEPIDGDGVYTIRLYFKRDKTLMETDCDEKELEESMSLEADLLESKLEVALMIAHAKFRLANRGALARFFGGLTEKIPTKEIIGKI